MKKNLMFALTLVLLVGSVSAQTSNCPMGGGMMYGLYGGYGSGTAILSWITYLAFIGLVIAGIYWLIKSANQKNNGRR